MSAPRTAPLRAAPLLLLAALACDRKPGPQSWTVHEAASGHLARLDRDHDGRVGEEEWNLVAWPEQDFSEVDSNHDGDIDDHELMASTAQRNPQTLLGPHEDPPAGPSLEQTFFPRPYPVRIQRDVLRALAAEVHGADPKRPLPDDSAIEAASASGKADDPAFRALLNVLRVGYRGAGLTFPSGLDAASDAAPSVEGASSQPGGRVQ